MIDYSHNPKYYADGKHTPVVSRCVCGHVLEWHYLVLPNSSPAYRHHNANRCPSGSCDCTTPLWDGEPPAKLPNIAATRSDAAVPAA